MFNKAELDRSILEFDRELLFKHPDNPENLNAMQDSMKEVSETLHPLGEVISGRGLESGTKLEFGGIEFPNILIPAHLCTDDVYAAVSYDAHHELYMNPKVFSSTVFEEMTSDFWGPALSPLDAPEHTKYRQLMQRGFTPKYIQSFEDTVVKPFLQRRLDELHPRGEADLARELHAFYPFEIVGRIVGFDTENLEFVAACFNTIMQGNIDPAAAMKAGTALRAYTNNMIAKRRKNPQNDILSAMLDAEVDGEKIPDDRLVGLTNNLMIGGVDTTYKQSGNLMHCLFTHPDQFDLLRSKRDLIPNTIEESLRYEGVGGITGRLTLEDTELKGVKIPKGKVIFTLHGVANRDPRRWDKPNKFDIAREQKPHMQFAGGPHGCIGKHLARMMLSHYISKLMDGFVNLRPDPEKPKSKITGWAQRSPLSIPVLWDA